MNLFDINEFYFEGEKVSIVCRNFNKRPGFLSREVWTDSSGNVVGNTTLQFMATKEKSGPYICSVPTVPDIPAVVHEIIVKCKCTLLDECIRSVNFIVVNTCTCYNFIGVCSFNSMVDLPKHHHANGERL